jgi:hypothetical protein
MNRLTETAPERIWLHDAGGRTTCSGQTAGGTVEYVRADLIEQQAKRIAELEAQLKAARDFMLND